MKKLIVADTGPLIALAKLELLHLLDKLFVDVFIPEEVFKEATSQCTRSDAKAIILYISTKEQPLKNIHNSFSESLKNHLDQGEIQAISHAKKLACGVLMDEKRGRKIAHHYHIPVVGVIGILLQAKQLGLLKNIKPYLTKLLNNDYRLSKALITEALTLAGE